jgi:hypothetical protein
MDFASFKIKSTKDYFLIDNMISHYYLIYSDDAYVYISTCLSNDIVLDSNFNVWKIKFKIQIVIMI